jgi:hypothetical protein
MDDHGWRSASGGIAQPGNHEICHQAEDGDEDIAADSMCRDQAPTSLCAGKLGGRLQDESYVDRAYQNKGNV